MSIEDFGAGVSAFRAGMQGLRDALGTWRDLRAAVNAGTVKATEAEAVSHHTEEQIALAEAQIAKGLGFPLCTCTYPPVIMMRVGYLTHKAFAPNRPMGSPVHQCPQCEGSDAGPFAFHRTVQNALAQVPNNGPRKAAPLSATLFVDND